MQEQQEMWVQSLGREEPLEEEMATRSSNPANPTDKGDWTTINKYLHTWNKWNK